MKKLIMLLSILFLGGCTLGDVVQNEAMLTAIELAGFNLGQYVGKTKTDTDDVAIADAYKLAREGSLTPEELAVAFAKLKIDNPQLAGSISIVLKRMGGSFNVNGELVGIVEIPTEYWDTARDGYVLGYELEKAGQKSMVRMVK